LSGLQGEAAESTPDDPAPAAAVQGLRLPRRKAETVTPLFSGELQFVTYADSSRGGPRVTLRLQDRDELQKFVGMEGKRLMAALVLIGDDEQPAPPPSAAKPEPEKPAKKRGGASLTFLAVQWCERHDFHGWLEKHYPAAWYAAERTTDAADKCAAEVIYGICGISSRAELDVNQEAADKFSRSIRIPFNSYLGNGS
jgi:hypothetical protein